MGAEFRDAKLAGSAQARAQALEGIRRRREALSKRPEPTAPVREEQTEKASMFPGEAPGVPQPPGFEEARFRRAELMRERDRTRRDPRFRRAEMIRESDRNRQRGQMNSGNFGFAGGNQQPPLRPGIMFGAGRTTRVPERGTPGYEEILNRLRSGMRR
jgi:hypothetical protein